MTCLLLKYGVSKSSSCKNKLPTSSLSRTELGKNESVVGLLLEFNKKAGATQDLNNRSRVC